MSSTEVLLLLLLLRRRICNVAVATEQQVVS